MKAKYFSIVLLFLCLQVNGGPPFNTDDPEPVDFRHWEYYLSSINMHQQGTWSGTLPHFEVNYGAIRDVQIHLLCPVNYIYSAETGFKSGYASTEAGFKIRFVRETATRPQIGIFPILEIPTVRNSQFGNGRLSIFLPLWIQKSWGKISSYGGGGYLFNNSSEIRNQVFLGWQAQYAFSDLLSLGGEAFFRSSPGHDQKNEKGFNIGGFINPSSTVHFLFSAGYSFSDSPVFSSYAGLQITI